MKSTIYKILQSKIQIAVLILLCIFCFSLRSYAIYRDMFFGPDQGRDAQEMRQLAKGKLTLIGPTTGLEGVFLGPFWYYLIFPAYLLGNWNPVASAYEMILFSVGVVVLLYVWGRKLQLPWAGLIAGTLYTFSFQNILFARWTSNPAPLPFFALLAFYWLWNAIEHKKPLGLVLSGIIFGLCIQLEAANATWFIPAVALILMIEFLPKSPRVEFLRSGFLVTTGFFLAELPHLLFELKHGFLNTKNLIVDLEKTRDVTLWQSLPHRIPLLFHLYSEALFRDYWFGAVLVFAIALILLLRYRKALFSVLGVRIVVIWFVVPLVFHILFTGNHGNFWDYYVISQHPVLYLILGIVSAWSYRNLKTLRGVILSFSVLWIGFSLATNLAKWTEIIQPYADRFSLQEQVDATNWMIDQANGTKYGAWVYNASAQDDAHRYVFWWVGRSRGIYPEDHVEQQPLIFLVVEDDPVFQKRHDEWIAEREKFGKLQGSQKFGAITVYTLQNTL